MIHDILNKKVEVGDIVVRPIFSGLRIGKVLKIYHSKSNTKITISCYRRKLIGGHTYIHNNPNIEEHNDSQTLDSGCSLLIITKDYYEHYRK